MRLTENAELEITDHVKTKDGKPKNPCKTYIHHIAVLVGTGTINMLLCTFSQHCCKHCDGHPR